MATVGAFLSELRRRRVFRVLAGYCAAALVAIEAANDIFPAINLPGWSTRLVVVLALLGVPVAVGLAWAFDVTPDGLTRTPDEPAAAAADPTPVRPRRVPALAAYAAVGVLVAAAGVAAYGRMGRRAAATEAERSVAVLPFVNMSGDPANEYFSDGVTEEILDALSNVPGLRVPARTSSFAFKGKPGDVAEIGRQLRVTHVLEGSVQRSGDRVRITAQLVDARTGFHQWSHAYTLEVKDVFAAEDEISRDIARQLQVGLDPGARLARGGTDDPRAHDLYLQGRQLIYAPAGGYDAKKANLLEAVAVFQRALGVDSTYALAWSGRASAYNWLAASFWPPSDAYPKAKQAAMRALALDPQLSEAHVALGQVLLFYDWDHPRAEHEVRRAIALDPGNPEAHATLGWMYFMRRRFREAAAEEMAAVRLDPANGTYEFDVLEARIFAGEGEYLLDSMRALVRARPHDRVARWRLISVAAQGGHAREAAQGGHAREAAPLLAQFLREDPHRTRHDPWVAYFLARAGDTAAARVRLDSVVGFTRDHYVRPTLVAQIYMAMGDRDSALDWLERGLRSRDEDLLSLDVWDVWVPLRGNPRFEEIRRRVGLTSLPP